MRTKKKIFTQKNLEYNNSQDSHSVEYSSIKFTLSILTLLILVKLSANYTHNKSLPNPSIKSFFNLINKNNYYYVTKSE